MSFPEVRGLVVLPLISPTAREAETQSATIDREDFDGAASILFCLQAGSGATTISASRIHTFEHDSQSATGSMTAITSGHTSGLTFTASGIIGLEIDLRGKGRFIGVTMSAPNVATSGILGLFAILGDGHTNPPSAATNGMISVRRIGQ